jgi:diadenosine tetraphosphate (Ap4A) HIT family hydrolase
MLIYETDHWRLKHRRDSKLPGYLILIAKGQGVGSLADLTPEALAELGLLQAESTRLLEDRFGARLVYVCRWGHEPGNPPHFHIIPLYAWVEEAYAADPAWPEPAPDGPVYCTYITRAFIEYEQPPSIQGPSVEDVVGALRTEFLAKDRAERQADLP